MRLPIVLGALLAAATVAFADRTKVDINAETPEGQLLQQIGQESEAAKKRALLEEFVGKHSNHAGILWVYGQLLPLYLEAKEYDKVFPVAEKLLAADPADAEMAHGALKAAEGKQDPDLVAKWAAATSEAARKAVAAPKPSDEEEVENWKRRVDYAKQVDVYSEYSLFNTALQTADPNKKILLAETLLQRNPKSQYAAQVEPTLFLAYRQVNNNDKALEVAERIIARDASNEDSLLFAAYQYFDKKQWDKAVDYSFKVVDVMKAKPAPQGVDAAQWESKKKQVVGSGLWLQGMALGAQNKHVETDKVLREALPYLEANNAMLGPALFTLGLANYRLGEKEISRIKDALDYNKRCAAIPGPYQSLAKKNIAAIQAKYRVQ